LYYKEVTEACVGSDETRRSVSCSRSVFSQPLTTHNYTVF